MDTFVEFLGLFIAACVGCIIGIAFMVPVLIWREREMKRQQQDIDNLYKELSIATGSHREDEHPEMGRSPPLGPMGDMPGASSGPMGDASVGRKG